MGKNFSVKVIEKVVVSAEEPWSDRWLPFTNLDVVLPSFDAASFFCYKKPLLPSSHGSSSSSFTTMLNTLKASLSRALALYYPLAGEIAWNAAAGENQIHCNNQGVDFTHAVADVQLKELDFYNPDVSIEGKLVPKKLRGVLAVQELERSGTYTVSSLRSALDGMCLKKIGTTTRWNVMVPLKVRIVLWRANLDRLPTKVNLLNKGVQTDSTLCVFCNEHQENGNHIFATCAKSTEVRRTVNKWWNVLTERCNNMYEVLGSFSNMKQASKGDIIKDVIIHAYVWTIWKGRNDAIFKGETFNTFRAANDIQSLAYSWVCNRSSFNVSWLDWSCNPRSL